MLFSGGIPFALRLNILQCDQKQPSCSRCCRLGIRCIGSGQQSLRFVGVNTIASRRSKSSSISVVALQANPLITVSANELDHLRSAFVSILHSDRIGFDMTLLGALFEDIPVRLGSNKALDLFTRAMIQARASLVLGHPSERAISSFSTAMTALRSQLQDPKDTSLLGTLSAIYMMIIYQVSVDTTSYGESSQLPRALWEQHWLRHTEKALPTCSMLLRTILSLRIIHMLLDYSVH